MLSIILFSIFGVLGGVGFLRSFRQLKACERGSDDARHLLKKFDRLQKDFEEGAGSERKARLLIESCEEFRASRPAMEGLDSDDLDKAALLLHGVQGEIRQGRQPISPLESARGAVAHYRDALNQQGNSVRSRLINPVKLVASGIAAVLILPLKPFRSFGLIDQGTFANLETGLIIRVVSQAGSIVGLISTALSIIFQWLDYYQSVFNVILY